jgi:hypothetical protein
MDEMKIPATHPKIHPFTQLPYWGSITEEMNSLLSNDKILHFRFFLIEISNQNVLFATYGLDYIDKVNQIIIAKLKSHYKGCKLFLVRLNTFAMILPEVRQDVEELVRLFEQPILVNGIPIYCEVTIVKHLIRKAGRRRMHSEKRIRRLNEAQLHQKPYQQYQPNCITLKFPYCWVNSKTPFKIRKSNFITNPSSIPTGRCTAWKPW